jgi:hypothetical protein
MKQVSRKTPLHGRWKTDVHVEKAGEFKAKEVNRREKLPLIATLFLCTTSNSESLLS